MLLFPLHLDIAILFLKTGRHEEKDALHSKYWNLNVYQLSLNFVLTGLTFILTLLWRFSHLRYEEHHQSDVSREDDGERSEGEGGVLLRRQDHRHRRRDQAQHLQPETRHRLETKDRTTSIKTLAICSSFRRGIPSENSIKKSRPRRRPELWTHQSRRSGEEDAPLQIPLTIDVFIKLKCEHHNTKHTLLTCLSLWDRVTKRAHWLFLLSL